MSAVHFGNASTDEPDENDNPYEGHPALTPLQAQILSEYAKLNRSLKSATALTAEINEARNDELLAQLRALEKQMGLVLTLFKASVWSYYRSQGLAEDGEEEEEEDGSLLHDREPNSPYSTVANSSGAPPPHARRPGDFLRAAARVRGRAGSADDDLSEGDLTADITAMPLPGGGGPQRS